MIEPIYTYVRGKGWVVECANVVTMSCGTVVRLECRHPRSGERFGSVWPGDGTYLNPDNTPNDTYMTWPKNTHYVNVGAYDGGDGDYSNKICLVLVKV